MIVHKTRGDTSILWRTLFYFSTFNYPKWSINGNLLRALVYNATTTFHIINSLPAALWNPSLPQHGHVTEGSEVKWQPAHLNYTESTLLFEWGHNSSHPTRPAFSPSVRPPFQQVSHPIPLRDSGQFHYDPAFSLQLAGELNPTWIVKPPS